MTTAKETETYPSAFKDFMNEFNFLIATSEESRVRAFSLRHQVFREELNYPLGVDRSAPYENDIHDEHAIICLVQHKNSGLDAGCLRVVIIENDTPERLGVLPLEESCKMSLNNSLLKPQSFFRSSICEVSRLAVHPDFRKSKDSIAGVKEHDIKAISQIDEKARSPIIGLSLFLAATAIVGLTKRQHVFAMMEPRFARLLKLSGLSFEQVGDLTYYYGSRAAFYIDQKVAEKKMQPNLKPFYHQIKSEISSQLERISNQDKEEIAL